MGVGDAWPASNLPVDDTTAPHFAGPVLGDSLGSQRVSDGMAPRAHGVTAHVLPGSISPIGCCS